MRDEKGTFRQLGLALVLAVAAYHLSVFGVLFLIPLEWARVRHGFRSFVTLSVAAGAAIGIVEVVLQTLGKVPWGLMSAVTLGLPLVLIAGWVAVVSLERLGWRFLYRLLAVTAVVGLVLFPLLAGFLAQPAVNESLERSFDAVWKQALETPGLNLSEFVGGLDQKEFFELLKEAFLGSFLLVLFLFWGFTGRVSRALDPQSASGTLKDFAVPAPGAIVLLVVWGFILVQGVLGRVGVAWTGLGGVALDALLNVAWITLVVHALAGWGIVESLMDRWRWPRFGRTALRVLTVLMILAPGAGQWTVLAGLPILSVLELWVNFRKQRKG